MITLTRDEAQQVLDAFETIFGLKQSKIDIMATVETLRARLAVDVSGYKRADVDETLNNVEKIAEPEKEQEPEELEKIMLDVWQDVGDPRFPSIKPQQKEQEPVGVVRFDSKRGTVSFSSHKNALPDGEYPVYTAPPQREWQGLTDEEIYAEANHHVFDEPFFNGAVWARGKIKEKNNG